VVEGCIRLRHHGELRKHQAVHQGGEDSWQLEGRAGKAIPGEANPKWKELDGPIREAIHNWGGVGSKKGEALLKPTGAEGGGCAPVKGLVDGGANKGRGRGEESTRNQAASRPVATEGRGEGRIEARSDQSSECGCYHQ
jgi:hypothetical protein